MTEPSTDSPNRSRSLLLIGLVLAVALAVRLVHFCQVRDSPLYQYVTLDEKGNHEFALAVLQDRLPAASYYKAPLYGYSLAGVYALLGDASIRARLVQCILVAVSPVLTALIAARLFGWAVGLIAGLWAAVFWTFVFFSTELLDAAPACVFYLLLAYLLVAWDDRRWTKWLACGLALGLGAVTRPNILAFAPVLAVTVVVVGRRRDRTNAAPRHAGTGPLLHAVALTIGCCLVVLPVTIRNRVVGGEWVLLGAYGGMNLHVANNPNSDSKDGPLLVDESGFLTTTTWDPNEPWARCCLNFKNAYRFTEAKLGRKPKRGEFGALLAGMGLDHIRQNPGWFARHALRRFCWLFNAYEYPSNKDLYHFLQFAPLLRSLSWFHYGWLAPLGLMGLALALADRSRRSAGLAYLVAMLASLALPAVMFIINSRFRLPMVHLLVVFAAFAVVETARMIRSPAQRRKLLIVVPGLAALTLFCNLDPFGYRKAHQPYLRLAYAVACLMSDRQDLLDDAIIHFEHDLKADLADLRQEGRRSNTTLLVDHCCPMRLLLPYYVQRGRQADAVRAAEWMLDHEPVDGVWPARLMDVFIAADRKASAQRALDVLDRPAMAARPDVMADCLFRFGRTWHDRDALTRAREVYERLARANPGEILFHERLRQLRKPPTTAPTTTRAATPRSR